jgi:hypothetical protein
METSLKGEDTCTKVQCWCAQALQRVQAQLCSALLPSWERPGIRPKTQASLSPFFG